MTKVVGSIPVALSTSASDLYLAYLRGEEEIMARFPADFADEHAIGDRVKALRGHVAHPDLWRAVRSRSERLGATEETLRSLTDLEKGKTLAVVAGQQPSLYGGTLLTAYKLLTAVALASHVEATTKSRCVPVFWLAADDVDFHEAAGAHLAGFNLHPRKFTLPSSAGVAGRPVGDIPVAEIEDTITKGVTAFRASPGHQFVERTVLDALAAASDFGEYCEALLHRLFGDTGVVVLDARLPEVRRSGADLLGRYLEHAAEVHRDLEDAGAALLDRGFHRQLSPRSTEVCLFQWEKGARKRFPEGEDWIAAARKLHAKDPALLWPNVALRPLLQDTVLPNVATVAGPSEIAYHAQISGAYERLGVSMPIVFPRLTGSIVPRELVTIQRATKLSWDVVFDDFEAVVRDYYRPLQPPQVTEAIQKLDHDVRKGLADLNEVLGELNPSLMQLVGSVRRKIEAQVDRLREGALGRLKSEGERTNPRLGLLREFLFPKTADQERALALVTAHFLGGAAAGAALLDAAREHVAEIVRAPLSHYLIQVEEVD